MEQMTLSSCSLTTCPRRPASPEHVISTRSIGTQEQPKTLSRATQTCAIKHCEDCSDVHLGDCPIHGPLHHIEDKPVPIGTPCRADLTLPEGLLLCKSSIPGALHGVYSMIAIPKRTCFGPYEGVVVEDVNKGKGYTWDIRNRGQRYLVDARPLSVSNWMRYINCADSEQEHNLVAYQYKGCIYYRTCKDVEPGSELLVWYGTQFARELGIGPHSKAEDEEKGKDEENGRSQFKCSQCGDVFSSVEYLHKHEKSKHSQKRGKRHQCCFCDYSSDDRTHVTQHERTHTGETPFVCETCFKAFTVKSNLKKHVNTMHKGERSFECSICGCTFQQKASLKRHERIHTCERPYLCEKCGKAFTQKSHLSTHVSVHTGIKPYGCPQCEKSFSSHGDLKRHVIHVHTREFPHECPTCQKGFCHPSELRKHMYKKHAS